MVQIREQGGLVKYMLEKSAVLSFGALKIIVFSALIFVITGCQRTDSEQSTSGPMPTVVSTKPPSSSQTVVAYNSSPTPMPSGSTRTPSPTPTPTRPLRLDRGDGPRLRPRPLQLLNLL